MAIIEKSTKSDIAAAINNIVYNVGVTNGMDSIGERIEKIERLTGAPEVAPETTTKLVVEGNKIYVMHYKDGFYDRNRAIMSNIKDIRVHGNTVVMVFADNTKTVAVLHDEDDFNLEQGISICITKKLLGDDGGAIYNKLIRKALKVMEQNEKAEKAAKEKEEAIKQRKKAAVDKRNKKKAKKRDEQIEIQKEAFVRAIETITTNNDKKLFDKHFFTKWLDK